MWHSRLQKFMVAAREFIRPTIISLPLRVVDKGATLRERFCADIGCAPAEFEGEIFRRCLRRRARILAWCFGGLGSKVFAPDLELIHRAGESVSIEEVRRALDDHWGNPANDHWLRRKLGARVSSQRLRWIASHYVPLGGGHGYGDARAR